MLRLQPQTFIFWLPDAECHCRTVDHETSAGNACRLVMTCSDPQEVLGFSNDGTMLSHWSKPVVQPISPGSPTETRTSGTMQLQRTSIGAFPAMHEPRDCKEWGMRESRSASGYFAASPMQEHILCPYMHHTQKRTVMYGEARRSSPHPPRSCQGRSCRRRSVTTRITERSKEWDSEVYK